MSLLQDINRLTEEFIRLDHEQMDDPSINNTNQMDDIQFQLFMLSTKIDEEQQNLVDRLNYYREKYRQGQPVISDSDYDDLYFELVGLEHYKGNIKDNSPTLAQYDKNIQNNFEDVTHNLGRNDNIVYATTISEIQDFVANKHIIAVVKPSGASCFLYYKNGYLIKAVTYGDGSVGKDITNNILALTPVIPRRIQYTEDLIVKGELTVLNNHLSYEDLFEYKTLENFALHYAVWPNPEEFKIKNLLFFATDIVQGLEEKELPFYDKLCYLNSQGFFISTTFFISILNEFIIDYLRIESERSQIPFSTIYFIENEYQYNDHTHKILCYQHKENFYQRKLKNIVWQRNADSLDLLPYAVHDTILLNNSVKIRHSVLPISPVDLTNELGQYPFKGQKIKIFALNPFLPNTAEAIEKNDLLSTNDIIMPAVPMYCPWCGKKLHQSKKYDIMDFEDQKIIGLQCLNPLCSDKLSNRIKYFCGENGLNIQNLSEETLQWLIDKQWITNFTDIYILKKYYNEWIIQSEFTKEEVDDILTSIENSKQCSFSDFICAMNIPLINKNTAIMLANYFKNYDNFANAIYFKEEIFSLPELNLQQTQIESLLNFQYQKFDELWNVFKYNQEIPYEKNYFYMPLRKKTYVVIGPTKYFDGVEWLCGYIHGEGGAVLTEVTENVDYVINNDPESNCSENVTARELGIPIITEQEFLSNIY